MHFRQIDFPTTLFSFLLRYTRSLLFVFVSFHTVIFLRSRGKILHSIQEALQLYKKYFFIELKTHFTTGVFTIQEKFKYHGKFQLELHNLQTLGKFSSGHTVRLRVRLLKGKKIPFFTHKWKVEDRFYTALNSAFFFFLSTLAYYFRLLGKSRTVYSHRRARGEK